MESLIRLILLFFAYSLLGWCIEVTLKYFEFHRFINRGFFTGPILPIYGSGAVLITLAAAGLSRFESGCGMTFALSLVICGTLEYLTGFFMEKRFHARWWDYSRKPMNLHGRVWIGNLLLFGLGGAAIVHLLNPLFDRLLAAFSFSAKEIAACAMLAVFAADGVLTHFVMKLVKLGVESSEADSTEEISKEVYLLLSDRSVFHKRFADAYPEVIYRTERVNARLAAVKAETERLRREAEQHLEERREAVADRLEPAALIRSRIISRQDELIGLLYDERTASDEIKAMKSEIDREKERLEERPLGRLAPGRRGD